MLITKMKNLNVPISNPNKQTIVITSVSVEKDNKRIKIEYHLV